MFLVKIKVGIELLYHEGKLRKLSYGVSIGGGTEGVRNQPAII